MLPLTESVAFHHSKNSTAGKHELRDALIDDNHLKIFYRNTVITRLTNASNNPLSLPANTR